MASVFCSTSIGLHYLIILLPQMRLEHYITVHSLTMNGLWGNGLPLSCRYQLEVVISVALWGDRWATKRVEFRSENMAVVSVLRSDTSKDPNIMVLLRHPSLFAARHSFAFMASLTGGRDNSIVDAYLVLISKEKHFP